MRWVYRLLGWIGGLTLVAWRRKCRYRVIGDQRPRLRADRTPYIYALLHAHTISASFGDYDLDGYLDLFLAHWGNDPQPDTETVWRNDGDGTFSSASVATGIADQLNTQTGLPGLFDYTFAIIRSDEDLSFKVDSNGNPTEDTFFYAGVVKYFTLYSK